MNSILDQQHELVALNLRSAADIIPPMTDPLGKYWEQPELSKIKIAGNVEALMTRATFKEIKDYTASRPTGLYVGKMWRRNEAYKENGVFSDNWMLYYCDHHNDPGYVSIRAIKIFLLD